MCNAGYKETTVNKVSSIGRTACFLGEEKRITANTP